MPVSQPEAAPRCLPVCPSAPPNSSAVLRFAALRCFPTFPPVCLSVSLFAHFFLRAHRSCRQSVCKRHAQITLSACEPAKTEQTGPTNPPNRRRADRKAQPIAQPSSAQSSPVQHSTALQTQAGRKACIAPFFPLLSTHLPLPFPSVSVYITDCEREPPELPFIASSSPSVRRAATTTWHKRECGLHPLPL